MNRVTTLLLSLLPSAAFAQQGYYNATRPIDHDAPVTEAVRDAPLFERTMVVIGDSYVRNHRRPIEETWHYRLAEKYHINYLNYGKNGNCVAFDRTRSGFGIPMYQRYDEMPDAADYVLVIAGHNDADMIGQASDESDDAARAVLHDSLLAEFRTRLGELLDSLIVKYPAAKLAFVTPWNVDRPGFPEVLETIRDVCGDHSVPLYDAARCSGIYVRDAAFRRRYFQRPNDTAHLNADGHALFMPKMEAFLLGL